MPARSDFQRQQMLLRQLADKACLNAQKLSLLIESVEFTNPIELMRKYNCYKERQ